MWPGVICPSNCLSLCLADHKLSVYLSFCLSVYQPFYLSDCPSVFLSIFPFVYLPICLSDCPLSSCQLVFQPFCLSAYLFICQSFYLVFYPSVYLPLCLSAYMLICQYVYVSTLLSACYPFSLPVYPFFHLSARSICLLFLTLKFRTCNTWW